MMVTKNALHTYEGKRLYIKKKNTVTLVVAKKIAINIAKHRFTPHVRIEFRATICNISIMEKRGFP